MNIVSLEQQTVRFGRLRLKKCGSILALTVFVVRAPKLNYDEEEAEVFYMDLENYRKDHTFFKMIITDFNVKIGSRRTSHSNPRIRIERG
ncbi:unnamed protein product [Angiostrongylus costaricensis]|uniref:Uncharacterized protein n=1 Tax=Angiostrongylus costaricensis TaxID=334426 RepID=A0A0R3PV54_ANGCS|nr:unnamed protein product [Angiostrongylus costaricensis]